MLTEQQKSYLKSKINQSPKNPIVRFIDSEGNTIRLEDGHKHPKWENTIHKTMYWSIWDMDTIKEIESMTGLKAKIEQQRIR